MNLADYIDVNLKSLSRKKKKNMVRKVKNKIRAMQPKVLEAKIMGWSKDHKVYKYTIRLENALSALEQSLKQNTKISDLALNTLNNDLHRY